MIINLKEQEFWFLRMNKKGFDKMKIKIIDLLNKIANGEEDDLLTEFEFDNRVWNFKRLNDSEFCLDGWLLNQNITITKHKEILEEPKKIEKWGEGALEEMEKCTDYTLEDLQKYIRILAETQNELIDEINNLKDND